MKTLPRAKTITAFIALCAATFLQSLPTAAQTVGWSQFANSPGVETVRHDDIYFTDPTNGWATQDNLIYRTTNGGSTWSTVLNSSGTHFRCITFATTNIGFAGNLGVGSYDSGVTDTNVMYATTNGGVTWSNFDGFAELGMKGLCSMYTLDSQHIYGGGRVRGPAFFIKSTNGGVSWSATNLTAAGVIGAIMDIYFFDTNNGWVVGMDTVGYSSGCSPPYHGCIAHTTNGGESWTPVVTTEVTCCYFWKMAWPSTNIGYVSLQQNNSAENIIFYSTTNGGATWVSNGIPSSSVGLSAGEFYLQGIGFVSTNEGWMGGASGLSSYGPSFLHTTNSGATWTPVGFNDTFYLNRFRFLSPNLGFASGANLYIYTNPLVITSQPQSQTVDAGNNLNLNVTAASMLPVSYQWKQNGTNIPYTSSTLNLSGVTRTAEGYYSVVVTNTATNLQSSNATIQILAAERLSAPVLLPGGQLQILFNDADGGALLSSNDISTFTVFVSTNLPNWTVLTNALTLTNGSLLLTDTWTGSSNRFYQVVEH